MDNRNDITRQPGPALRYILFLLFPTLLCLPQVVRAQLISPGKLTSSHAEIDRIDSCTSCHTLGRRSIDPALCLDCHTPLRKRIETDAGFHATLAEPNCATCHKDHFGREFDAIRFDTTAFIHRETGFELIASHADVTCALCHRPEFIRIPLIRSFKEEHGALDHTYMGLQTACRICHESDSDHGDQFGDTLCSSCHDESVWTATPGFSHSSARFALTGEHLNVTCEKCHSGFGITDAVPGSDDAITPFRGVAFATCATCHEDVHDRKMGATCRSCHQTTAWRELVRNDFESTFSHDVTGLALVGAHTALECGKCHDRLAVRSPEIRLRFLATSTGRRYPIPVSDSCDSCHLDPHEGEFVSRSPSLSCQKCHDETAWAPGNFDFISHNEETGFLLTGSHVAVLCSSCHTREEESRQIDFRIEDTTCRSCHVDNSPHGNQFEDEAPGPALCETCHTTNDWNDAGREFDHSATGFPLEGRHVSVACVACHVPDSESAQFNGIEYRGLESTCESCHIDSEPHNGQFVGQACASCHDVRSFHLTSFDHSKTQFPLDGAHLNVNCADCHSVEMDDSERPFIRFKPLGTTCSDCHKAR